MVPRPTTCDVTRWPNKKGGLVCGVCAQCCFWTERVAQRLERQRMVEGQADAETEAEAEVERQSGGGRSSDRNRDRQRLTARRRPRHRTLIDRDPRTGRFLRNPVLIAAAGECTVVVDQIYQAYGGLCRCAPPLPTAATP